MDEVIKNPMPFKYYACKRCRNWDTGLCCGCWFGDSIAVPSNFKREASPQKSPGTKHDQHKPRWDLLPYDAVSGTVDVLTFGASKYEDRNWEQGIQYGRVFAALQRHITAWWCGEDIDPESGLPHLDHAACCVMFLQAFSRRGRTDLDDRPVADEV